MPYRYVAITADGQQTRGVLNVDTEQAAEVALWERDLTIVHLQSARQKLDLARQFPTLLGPKSRDIILFSRQLATLIDSGVAITSALRLLAGQVSNKYLARVVGEIEDDVHMGNSLSNAMKKHTLVFSNLYCRMIEVGERSGNLGKVLRQLADYVEKAQATLTKVRSAMAYPSFVLLLAVFVVIILINVALPPMVRLFDEFGAELPWTTRLLIGITEFFMDYGLYIFSGSGAAILLIVFYVSRPSGRRRMHKILLGLPILGKINAHGTVARLSRTMSILIAAGLALPEVIRLSKETIGNVVLREALEGVREETLQGRGLSEPLARVRYFPKMLSYLVRVGEETGTLESHLATVADFYEEEVDRALRIMTTMLEPALIIFIGLIVGFVAVSVIMPMYSLLGAIK
ncbi:MAG: type II secretion system F family protein [Anaerolineae bacterium]|nr:MAG: type II secretion system F family protein [Anaerolineae bacterium]